MNIQGKTALVTGAGRGLGRAAAFALAARGAHVVLVSRSPSALDEVRGFIRARGGLAHSIVADVADPEQIYPLVGQAAALAGPISILLNNASTLGPVPLRPLLDTDCEDFERALAVNLLGPFRITKAVLGSMIARDEGLIVNISSDAAVNPYSDWGAYSVTKAALDHLTRIWAQEVQTAGLGIRFLSFDPGEMDTKMHREALPAADPKSLKQAQDVAETLLDLIQTTDWVSGARILEEAHV